MWIPLEPPRAYTSYTDGEQWLSVNIALSKRFTRSRTVHYLIWNVTINTSTALDAQLCRLLCRRAEMGTGWMELGGWLSLTGGQHGHRCSIPQALWQHAGIIVTKTDRCSLIADHTRDEVGDEQPRKEIRPSPTQNHSASAPSGMDEEVT